MRIGGGVSQVEDDVGKTPSGLVDVDSAVPPVTAEYHATDTDAVRPAVAVACEKYAYAVYSAPAVTGTRADVVAATAPDAVAVSCSDAGVM
jgi:hypothetical protein